MFKARAYRAAFGYRVKEMKVCSRAMGGAAHWNAKA